MLNKKRAYAYEELSRKIDGQSHFGKMTSIKEVRRANDILKGMIKRRKKKNEFWGIDKVKFAPNLMELQRSLRKK